MNLDRQPLSELISVVGGGALGVRLDLNLISEELDAEALTYEPEIFGGLYFKLTMDGPTIMLFNSGNYNITGAKDIEHLHNAYDQMVSQINPITGNNIMNRDVNVRNLVFRTEYGRELNLLNVALDLTLDGVKYEPDNHCALLYQPAGQSGTLIVYENGTTIATGFKQQNLANQMIYHLFENLDELIMG